MSASNSRRKGLAVAANRWGRALAHLGLVLLFCAPAVAQENKAPVQPKRFVDRGAYVEDTQTGLLWQKDGAASGKKNFHQAADYAKGLELGGLKGWRVPTAEELKAIFPAHEAPFVNTKYNPNQCCEGGEFASYWTSDLDRRLDDYAFVYQWYDKGGANNCYASRNFCYVRCVLDAARAVPQLKREPLTPAEREQVQRWIADLAADNFGVRERATAELKSLGARIRLQLEEALLETRDAERIARLKALLAN